ncbi:MAG: hypothetical protein LBJ35_07590 [Spirochaetaceae bacterium]|jgi:hypothetical protein|nr:hypothetical protein [Spirochaetaceae bacterium]
MTNNINTQCQLPEHFYDKDDLARMFLNRKIYIWGAGRDGKGVFQMLKRNGYQAEAFFDSSPLLWNEGGGGGKYRCLTPAPF